MTREGRRVKGAAPCPCTERTACRSRRTTCAHGRSHWRLCMGDRSHRFRARFRGGDGQTERDACSAEGEGGSASWGTRRHTSAASAASTAASATASAASAAELVYRRTGHNWFMASWERRAPHGPRFHDGSAFTNGIRVTTLKRKPKVDCF